MARYQLDDPRLQDELDRLAAEVAANWPPADDAQLAQLARILPVPTAPRTGRRSGDQATRRAA
ncbi:hypothetical protein ACVCAH_11350 [Micromonospora sp. LZ34]